MAKHKKQFGVWMDSRNAIVVGRQDIDEGDFVILDHVKHEGVDGNSSENTANNQEITLTHKYFKEILATVPNMDEVHVTGTGQIQEQFIHFMADTAQYKNIKSTDCTLNKMSDEAFVEYISAHFH